MADWLIIGLQVSMVNGKLCLVSVSRMLAFPKYAARTKTSSIDTNIFTRWDVGLSISLSNRNMRKKYSMPSYMLIDDLRIGPE
jgi:hypothetical protein